MTIEAFQILSNFYSTIVLIGMAVWWSRKSKIDRLVKGILLIGGMMEIFTIILNL